MANVNGVEINLTPTDAMRAEARRYREWKAEGNAGGNYKSMLQEKGQRDFGMTPQYDLIDEKGPDHSKCFKVAARIGGTSYRPAWGRNKKEAEQRAAMNALAEFAGEPVPFDQD